METIAVTMIALEASLGSTPKLTPIAARMKENSPICASATATERAMRKGLPKSLTTMKAARGLPMRTIPSVARMRGQSLMSEAGLNSIPTETKKRTAKAARMGTASAAACELNSDWPTTMPLRKAPRAMEAPKKLAAPTATPRARTRTERVNRSRVPVRAT